MLIKSSIYREHFYRTWTDIYSILIAVTAKQQYTSVFMYSALDVPVFVAVLSLCCALVCHFEHMYYLCHLCENVQSSTELQVQNISQYCQRT